MSFFAKISAIEGVHAGLRGLNVDKEIGKRNIHVKRIQVRMQRERGMEGRWARETFWYLR
jgi:hypothetical protein